MARILIIEDEDNLRFTIRKALSKSGHEPQEASTLSAARALIATHSFDLVLTDVSLGSENGLDLVKELRADGFDGVVVVMTAFSSVQTAVSAMRLGADDYLQKPLSLEELSLQVEKWLEHRRLAQRVKLYERIEETREKDHEALGESPAWKATMSMVNRVAAVPLGVDAGAGATTNNPLPCILLMGETGAGKGVLARCIHARAEAVGGGGGSGAAGRSGAPFVHVNCSALPANLVEGELFGHEKGAFTDAREARAGLFEMADGGTIFLDEISEMPLDLQSKLLLVVESGRFRRVGGTRERSVRVRVIAASNQDLERRSAAGQFRRDLLYRLNAFTVRIPALRDRGQDSLLIADAMLERSARQYGRGRMHLSESARTAILHHAWPGNVRELVNAVQRAVMMCDGVEVSAEDLGLAGGISEGFAPSAEHDASEGFGHEAIDPTHSNGTQGLITATTAVAASPLVFDFVKGVHTAAAVEKELVMQALRFTHGNVSRAARLIGMQRSSLRYRIDRYRLENFVVEVANR